MRWTLSRHRNEALRLYEGYHRRALREARAAFDVPDEDRALKRAFAVDAFGCHFLTDLFATGHLRVPRRLLNERFGILVGSLFMSYAMHHEDNQLGLWCRSRNAHANASIWHAFGDLMLRRTEAAAHQQWVQEAVRRSAAEVFAAYCGVEVEEDQTAVALLPVPLPPGEEVGDDDKGNHWPLYVFDSPGRVLQRMGGPYEKDYFPVSSDA